MRMSKASRMRRVISQDTSTSLRRRLCFHPMTMHMEALGLQILLSLLQLLLLIAAALLVGEHLLGFLNLVEGLLCRLRLTLRTLQRGPAGGQRHLRSANV